MSTEKNAIQGEFRGNKDILRKEILLKAIETKYNGYKFRSRLEARWAVFFDEMGIKYEYEPEGFELSDGTKYLPDFYLPESGSFFEVKGMGERSIFWTCSNCELWVSLAHKYCPNCGAKFEAERALKECET